MMKIQSILLRKTKFKNKNEAINFIKRNGFKVKKIDITKNFYRFRQLDPRQFRYFRNKKINNKIELIFGFK